MHLEYCTGNIAQSCRIGNLTIICKSSGSEQYISSILYQGNFTSAIPILRWHYLVTCSLFYEN